jgi:hypothetical protein
LQVSNPIFSVAALGIYVIEALKIVSYVHVNYWGRCAREEIRAIKEKKSQTTSDLKDEVGSLLFIRKHSNQGWVEVRVSVSNFSNSDFRLILIPTLLV